MDSGTHRLKVFKNLSRETNPSHRVISSAHHSANLPFFGKDSNKIPGEILYH